MEAGTATETVQDQESDDEGRGVAKRTRHRADENHVVILKNGGKVKCNNLPTILSMIRNPMMRDKT
jgi:hypothetical protein